MGVQELRKEVATKCNNLEALLVYSLAYWGSSLSKDIETIRAKLPTAPARRLRELRDALRLQIRNVTTTVGCKVKPESLREKLEQAKNSGVLFVHHPKWWMDGILFSNLGALEPSWKTIPPHALIAIDVTGKFTASPATFEYLLPEAALYEDMCFAYNQAVASSKDFYAQPCSKVDVKAHFFFVRTAVLSAFYLVEAYLNGIAFDFWVRDKSSLLEKDIDTLLEWDSKKDREKWLNLRDKILQYPKIILGLQHPPLTETNCPELDFFLSDARQIRDALVHPSPKIDLQTFAPLKQRQLVQLKLEDATRIVDNSVKLVLKINEILGKPKSDLAWLCPRNDSGRFPEKAFA